MTPRSRMRALLALTATAWSLVIPAASAYVDPGSTSLIFSWIVAGLAAAGMTLRIFWSRVKGLFRSDEEQDEAEESPDESSRPRSGAAQD